MTVNFTTTQQKVVFTDTDGAVTFTAATAPVVFTAAISGPQGPAGAAGATGATGAAGADGFVPDTAWNEVDISSSAYWLNLFGTFDGGTGFAAYVRWQRMGRLVMGNIVAEFGADHGTGMVLALALDATNMPGAARKQQAIGGLTNAATSSSFGFVTVADTSGDIYGAPNNDGFVIGLGPTTFDPTGVASSNAGLTWIHTATALTQQTVYGTGNLWHTDGNADGSSTLFVPSVDGRAFGLVSAFWYEAAAAA